MKMGGPEGGCGGEDRILRLPQVAEAVGMKKSSIYDLAAKGLFPRPVGLGLRAVGWRSSEIQAWIAARTNK